MKLWVKYIIASCVGVALGIFFPASNQQIGEVLTFLSELVVRFGRYMVLPLVFFSAVVAFNKLRADGILFKASVWTLILTVLSTAVLTFLGFLSVVLVNIPRIPVVVSKSSESASIGVPDLLRAILPYSPFETLTNSGFVLPAFIFAFLLGTAAAVDKITFKPVIQLADSLSRLSYNIATFFTEFLSMGFVVIFAMWTVEERGIVFNNVNKPLAIIFGVNFAVMALVIYPILVFALCHDKSPYRILYASLCSLVASLATGDCNFVIPLNMRHLKESLGVHRRINVAASTTFSVFARGGSALVTIVSFFVIYHSYSNLAISLKDIIWVTATSFGLSFLLGAMGINGTFMAICVLCKMYGQGFENGFLLLKPIAPLLGTASLAFDTITNFYCTYIVGVKTKFVERKSIARFI